MSVAGNLECTTSHVIRDGISSRAIHWDALSAAVQYSSNHFAAHNGSLIHGRTLTHFDASAALAEGVFPIMLLSLCTLMCTRRRPGDRPDCRSGATAGRHSEVSARYPVPIRSSWRRTSGRTWRNGLRNQRAQLKSDLRLAGGQLQFNNIETTAYDAALSGSASVSITGNEFCKNPFRLNLSGRNLDLARLPHFQVDRFTAHGIAISRCEPVGLRGSLPSMPTFTSRISLSIKSATEISTLTLSPKDDSLISMRARI